uniref:Basic tail secreted protein n=1 Tax=Rhipicephalus appendiculatus TaxID=34631 RepID=A0A131YNK0_RHIAP
MAHLSTFGILAFMWTAYANRQDCGNPCLVEMCPAVMDSRFNTYLRNPAPDPDLDDCMKVWCPSVRSFSKNKWLCPHDVDPDTVPSEEYAYIDPEVYADAWDPVLADETEEHRQKWIEELKDQCTNKDGQRARDGTTCMMKNSIYTDSTDPAQCSLGVCKGGQCVSATYSRCAI